MRISHPLLALLFATLATTAQARPTMAGGNPIKKVFAVGTTTTLNMRSLLVDPANPKTLTWQTSNTKPAWVVLTGDNMAVTPPSGGTFPTFVLSVCEPSAGPGIEPECDFRNFQIQASRPPVWSSTDLGRHDEKALMTVDLTTLATQPDSEPLTFSIEDPRTNAAWLSISGNNLTGTPQRINLGAFDLILVATSTTSGLSAKQKAFGEVRKVPVPAKFTANPITLPNATEDLAYSQTVNTALWVTHPEPEPLSFEVVNAKPAWLGVGTDGSLSGTPVRADKGPVSVTLKVSQTIDGKTYTDTTVVKFNVLTVNKPPSWSKNPILLPDAPVKKLVTAELTPFASDIDGDSLLYKKISGPAWADVTTTGTLTGTPTNTDIGPHTFEVEVFDGHLTARTQVQIKVFNTAPVWLANPVVLKNAKEDFDYSEDLRNYSKDADNDLLGFEKLSGPTWVVVDMDGSIHGTPRRADLGLNSLRVKMSDGFNPPVEVDVRIDVDRTNKPPQWNPTLITLKDAPERSAYTDTVAPFASDPDSDPLEFEKVSGPAWASFDKKGAVTGTPQRPDVGQNTFIVRVKDKEGLSTTATVLIKVLKVNRMPEWTKTTIDLGTAVEGSAFSFELAPFATDADGDALTFKQTSGPPWQSTATSGRISGTPSATDIGNYTAAFEVFDGEATATVNAIGKVVKANKPPRWLQDPIVLVPNARAEESYQNNLASFATDPDGDSLSFKKLSGPGWASISSNGLISGLPKRPDVKMNIFTAEVTDGSLTAAVTIQLQVDKPFEPPKWAQDPLLLPDALEGSVFNFNLLPLVTDPENDPLSFKILKGPAWLTISTVGQLSGVPQKTDVGTYPAVFEVSDGRFQVSVSAIGRVVPRNDPPKINQNALVFTVKERATLVVDLTDPKYLSDPDGDRLTFNLLDTRDWVNLNNAGLLTLTPKHKDLGDVALNFTVADAKNPAVTGKLIIQVQPDPKPPIWKTDPIRFTAKAGQAFSRNLTGFVSDIDGLPLTFAKKTGPAWMGVNQDGTISGTPAESDVRENTFLVTAKNEALGADVTVIVTVTSGNSPPVWSKDPVVLPDATVSLAYAQGVSSYVTDPDGDTLKFEKLSGPDWAYLTTAGMFIGVPEAKDLGVASFRVRAKDTKGAFADVNALIQVKTANLPPEWKQNPIPLGDAIVNLPFNFNLVPFVNNPDTDQLTFKKISGPTWLLVTTDGQIAGTPKEGDLGAYTAVFEVTDGTTAVRVDAFGQVIKGNRPPVLNLANLVFTVKERQTLNVNLNQPMYVTEPDGDTLTFLLLDAKPWTALSGTGALTLKPQRENVGDHVFTLRVTDSKNQSVEGPLTVHVIKDSRAPVWLENPIRFTATENSPFSATLTNKVFNPLAPAAVTFAKLSGPAWMSVGSGGNLSGTPKKSDIGIGNYVVTATNSDGSATADLIVEVLKDNSQGEDSVRIDDPVPGARADTLWVIDNSPTCSGNAKCLLYDLQKYIDLYFAALDKAGVHHLGMYYSTDACRYTKPIRDSFNRLLMSWTDNDNADSFIERLNNSQGDSKYNAPLVQMYRFFRDVPTMPSKGDYFENEVPLDAMVVSAHPEVSEVFQSSGSPIDSWGLSDFLTYYKKIADLSKKPFRISSIAPKCPTTAFPSVYKETDYCYTAYPSGNAYQQMATGTGGTFYEYNSRTSVRDSLLDYAEKIIFSATVSAHKKIPLSSTPRDPKRVSVTLAGKTLTGNTGSPSDQWTYEAATNSVVLFWNQIDRSNLKPGDTVVVTYPK